MLHGFLEVLSVAAADGRVELGQGVVVALVWPWWHTAAGRCGCSRQRWLLQTGRWSRQAVVVAVVLEHSAAVWLWAQCGECGRGGSAVGDDIVGGALPRALVSNAVGQRGGYTVAVDAGVVVGDVLGNMSWLRDVEAVA